MQNIFTCPEDVQKPGSSELFENLLAGSGNFRVERIVSYGQVTPAGEWYDQESDEWVLVLEGEAKLGFACGTEVSLRRGESLLLPRRLRHRVLYTSSPCIWLAIHASTLTAG
jgi:cupin 2 domain-containing protein